MSIVRFMLSVVAGMSLLVIISCSSSSPPTGNAENNEIPAVSPPDDVLGVREDRVIFSSDLDIPGVDQLYSMHPDGSNLVRVQPDKPGVEPALSPNGAWIAFSISDIRIIDSRGTGTDRELTFPDIANGTYDSYPTWAPSSDKIAFVRFSVGNAPAIYTVEVDSGSVEFVTAAGERANWEVFGLDWAPDGETLIWGAWDPLGIGTFSAIRLLEAPADGSRAGAYLVDGSTPQWRSDAMAIAWVSSIGEVTLGNPGAVGGIRIGQGREPTWAPDGRSVLFQSTNFQTLNVYNAEDRSIGAVLNTHGSNVRGMSWGRLNLD